MQCFGAIGVTFRFNLREHVKSTRYHECTLGAFIMNPSAHALPTWPKLS